jgi:hypothetical protein
MGSALEHPRVERSGVPAVESLQEHYNWDDAALALERLYFAVLRGEPLPAAMTAPATPGAPAPVGPPPVPAARPHPQLVDLRPAPSVAARGR